MVTATMNGYCDGAFEHDCARCHQRGSTLNVRNEHLCAECFLNYVGVKVSKRMESNNLRSNLRDEPKTLLVALSLGASSLAMLHALDQNTKRQSRKTGRAGYKLQILLIDPPGYTQITNTGDDVFSLAQERYPNHIYTRLPLEESLDQLPHDLWNSVHSPHSKDWNEQAGSPMSSRLEFMLKTIASSGSRGDVIDILRDKLITSVAINAKADAILYGDSTTRLAEKTLAETAKGKGSFVPWLTADGSSPRGIQTIYPMRDLLRKELLTYIELVGPSLQSLVEASPIPTSTPTSSSHTSMDSLMQQYFSNIEEQYPSIVANVVRTSGKLIAPQIKPQASQCSLCDLPILESVDQNNQDHNTGDLLCYGCRRITIE